jgi:hypothetical protein
MWWNANPPSGLQPAEIATRQPEDGEATTDLRRHKRIGLSTDCEEKDP